MNLCDLVLQTSVAKSTEYYSNIIRYLQFAGISKYIYNIVEILMGKMTQNQKERLSEANSFRLRTRTTMKKLSKTLVPIIAVASIIAGCGKDTNGVDTSNTIIKTDAPSDATDTASSSEKSSSAVDASSDTDSASSASTKASTTEIATNYDESLPTVVFLGDDQFYLGRDDNTSISYYVGTLLETNANVINLGCSGVNASTPPKTEGDKSVNFVNTAKFIAGEMDDSFWDNYPDAKAEAFCFSPSDVDFYVIEYGINDFLNIRELVDDSNPRDSSCYINALRIGIDLLKQVSPNAKIIVCSPVYSIFFAEDGSMLGSGQIYANTFGRYLDYCSACIQMTSEEECIPFDAFYNKYMDISDITTGAYLQEDCIHLSRAGRNTFAAVVAHLINKQLGLDNTSLESPYEIGDYMLPGETY